jgi:hypothetical protein
MIYSGRTRPPGSCCWVQFVLLPLWTSPGAWIFWAGCWCYSASAGDGGRYGVLQHLTFPIGVVEYYGGVPWPWYGYTDRFAQRKLATREENVTYTRWFKGQIVFDGTRQSENFTGWQAKVLKMIWYKSAQAVKCVVHNCRENYCHRVVLWWSDMLWRV